MPEITHPSLENEGSVSLVRYISIAETLIQLKEPLPFPGIENEWYAKLKAVDEEYPGYTIPTDEIIARMEEEGIKVLSGKDPESGNIFILPYLATTEDIETWSLSPYHLNIVDGMDEMLKDLILTSKARHKP